MAQMASLLVVATVFVALWTLNIYILQSERAGGLIHETKLPMQELEPKLQGGAYTRGGAYLRDSTVPVNMHNNQRIIIPTCTMRGYPPNYNPDIKL